MKKPVDLKIFLFSWLLLAVLLLQTFAEPRLSLKEYTARVFNNFEKYQCSHEGICGIQKSLSYLHKKWPHIYNLGFSILENVKN